MIKQLLLSLLFVSSAVSAQIQLPSTFGNLSQCDDDYDGQTVFDLTTMTAQILSMSGNPVGFDVYYYASATDATDNPDNPIANPNTFINTSNPQTIGIRVFEIADPSNFGTSSLTLNVIPLPVIQPGVQAMVIYSNDPSGLAAFPLELQIPNIVTSPDQVVTFHPTMTDALLGVNAIQGCYHTVNPALQTIYFTVTDPANSGQYCTVTSFFDLIVSFDPNPNELLGVPDNQFLYSLFLADETNNIAFDACGNSMIVDTNDDGMIQVDEAARVFALDVSNRGIVSLEGINAFTSLRSLTTDNNPLTSLDLSGIPVTQLSCIDNNLEWINLTNGMLHQALESGTTPWSGNPDLWKVCGDDAELGMLNEILAASGYAFEAGTYCTLSVVDRGLLSARLFPNPAASYFTVDSPDDSLQIEIFDVSGRQIAQKKALSAHEKTAISDWKSGVYLVRLTSGQVSKTLKLVKE